MMAKILTPLGRCATLLICALPLAAEQGILVVHIEDIHGHPIAGVRLRAGAGGSISAAADSFGAVRIRLASRTKPGDFIMLEIVAFPKGKDLVMISPWDNGALVPPFDDEAKNFLPVKLVERGNRACLETDACTGALRAQLVKAQASKAAVDQNSEQHREGGLAKVSGTIGLKPEEIDQAVRASGTRATDPYDKGMAFLYERRYAEATVELEKSREDRKRAEAKTQLDVANSSSFLGQAFYELGQYRRSAEVYQDAARRKPDDDEILNNLGLSWTLAGDYAKAEPPLRRALAIREKTLGSNHPDVATSLSNLAAVLQDLGDYAGAELLLRNALRINEKALGLDDPSVAISLNNLAELLQEKGDYPDAGRLFFRAQEIAEKAAGSDGPLIAAILSNSAALLEVTGGYDGPKLLFQHVLSINERLLGPDHPNVGTSLSNLASVLKDLGDYAKADLLFLRALAILRNALGPDHPMVALVLNNWAMSLNSEGDISGAETQLHAALSICQKTLSPDHPLAQRIRDNLDSLLKRSR